MVDVSLLGSGLWAMQPAIAGAHASGQERLAPLDRRRPANPLWNVYRTADGRFVALSMLEGDRYWPGFCMAVGRPELVADERFADAVPGWPTSRRAWRSSTAVRHHTLAEWKEILGAQEGPWSVTQTPRAALDDQQAADNDYLQWVKYDNGATLPLVNAPAQIDGGGDAAGRPRPRRRHRRGPPRGRAHLGRPHPPEGGRCHHLKRHVAGAAVRAVAGPVPVADIDSAPFWAGLRSHELRILRCGECRTGSTRPRRRAPAASASTWRRKR